MYFFYQIVFIFWLLVNRGYSQVFRYYWLHTFSHMFSYATLLNTFKMAGYSPQLNISFIHLAFLLALLFLIVTWNFVLMPTQYKRVYSIYLLFQGWRSNNFMFQIGSWCYLKLRCNFWYIKYLLFIHKAIYYKDCDSIK